MFLIQIDVQCADRFFEVLPSEVENTEFVVEDLVGHILLEYFGEVIVDRVIINFSPRSAMELQYCSIHIQAHCLSSSSAMSPGELGNMELVLEEKISSPLVELFGTVDVERLTISSSPYANVTL